ncbi:MAG TPA: polysaccharide pyruvyl transferase family protein [Solirubrobacteraceae bacterium]
MNQRWFTSSNFGDVLAVCLAAAVAGDSLRLLDWKDRPHSAGDAYLSIGSILAAADASSIVWGTGFAAETSRVTGPPREITAVRGPMTRRLLIDSGIACPEVYGDVALLLPRFVDVPVTKRFELGIACHYVDRSDIRIHRLAERGDVTLIDLLGPPRATLDHIRSCRRIASSSLHGLVVADAYGIPAIWISVTDALLGGWFKFHDYHAAIACSTQSPIQVTCRTTVDELCAAAVRRDVVADLDALAVACPFPTHQRGGATPRHKVRR